MEENVNRMFRTCFCDNGSQNNILSHLKPFVKYLSKSNNCKDKLLNDKYSQEREKHSL